MKIKFNLQKININIKFGFTLTEFLVILGIFAIITSISIPVLSNLQPTFQLNGVARDLISDIRYAQQLAVSEQIDYGIRFSTTTINKYQIIKHENDTTINIIKEEILPKEVNFKYISPLTENEIKFNPYGAVYEAATTTLINSKGAIKTIKVSPSGFVKILD